MWLACCFDVAYGRVHARAPDPIISVILQVGWLCSAIFGWCLGAAFRVTTRTRQEERSKSNSLQVPCGHCARVCDLFRLMPGRIRSLSINVQVFSLCRAATELVALSTFSSCAASRRSMVAKDADVDELWVRWAPSMSRVA